MEKRRSKTAERILDLTLEIIYLLTGENYISFKLSDGLVASNYLKPQSPQEEPPSQSPRQEKKKVQEVTKEIIELLMGEVPIRCQDVAVYFSMEEWEYVEGHKELYKNVMEENWPPFKTPDGSSNRNPPERCPRPLYSRDSTQEHQEIPQEDQSEDFNKVVVGEDPYVMADNPCKEVEVPPEIGTDPGGSPRAVRAEKELEHVKIRADIPLVMSTDVGTTDDDITCSSSGEHPMTLSLPPAGDVVALSTDLPPHSCHFPDHSPPIIHHAAHKEGEPFPCFGESSSQRARFTLNQLGLKQKKPYACLECGKCFPRKQELIGHQRTHTAVKLFPCSDCKRCFTRKGILIEHQRTHTGKKPYSCMECGKSFTQKHALTDHEKTHTQEKSHSCLQCGKCFSFKSSLARHERTHTGEKPFQCLECEKYFSNRQYLVLHRRIHTGEKPYSCSECGKCFSNSQYLVLHSRIHTGEKPYSCLECGKCFARKSVLNKHAQIHRGRNFIPVNAVKSTRISLPL